MKPSISVITVTLNAAKHLPGLIRSLQAQTDRDFEWIVVDAASTDNTVQLIKSASDLVTNWISEPDFGIYDGINKALQISTGEYYLVVGADDRLNRGAVEQFRCHARSSGADIVTAKIVRNGKIEGYKPRWPWLYAHHAYVSEHSVGTLIRKGLHEKFGLYSKKYSIGADLLFLKKACSSPETKVMQADFVAGIFGFAGTSREDRTGAICDYFRGQLETERHKYFQIIIFLAKVLKNAQKIVKSTKTAR